MKAEITVKVDIEVLEDLEICPTSLNITTMFDNEGHCRNCQECWDNSVEAHKAKELK